MYNVGDTAFSPDSKTIVWAIKDGENYGVYVIDASTGKVKKTLKGVYGGCLAFSPDNKRLAIGDSRPAHLGNLSLWDVASGTQCSEILSRGAYGSLDFLAFLPDGRTLLESRFSQQGPDALLARDGPRRMLFLNAATGEELRTNDTPHTLPSACSKLGTRCLSSDGKLFALANRCGVISIWDMTTGKGIGPADGIHSDVGMLAFSPNSKRIVTLAGEIGVCNNTYISPELYVWETDTARLDRKLVPPRTALMFPTVFYSRDDHLNLFYKTLSFIENNHVDENCCFFAMERANRYN